MSPWARLTAKRPPNLVDVSNANFYEAFEFNTSLPGVSMLRIECIDHDDASSRTSTGRPSTR